MVAFQASQLPPSCTTVEQVAVWAIATLANLNPDLSSIEALNSDGTPVPVRCAQATVYQITAVKPSVPRFIGRISIPLSPRYQASGTSLWAKALPIDSVNDIPVGFTGTGT